MKIEVPDNIPCKRTARENATVYEEILAYPTVTLAAYRAPYAIAGFRFG